MDSDGAVRRRYANEIEENLDNQCARLQNLNARLAHVTLAVLGPQGVPAPDPTPKEIVQATKGFIPIVIDKQRRFSQLLNEYETLLSALVSEFMDDTDAGPR